VKIDQLDHLVLTVRDVEVTCAFYSRVLNMQPVTFAAGRRALSFGHQKLNLHPADAPISTSCTPTIKSLQILVATANPVAIFHIPFARNGLRVRITRK